MSIITTNPIKQIKEKSRLVSRLTNIINGFKDRGFSFSDHVHYLLKASESSDAKEKNRIENHLVKMQEEAVPHLIESLSTTTGSTRGLVAMALIRIGSLSISYLEEAATESPELQWISDYIINEINGTQIKLADNSVVEVEREAVLA